MNKTKIYQKVFILVFILIGLIFIIPTEVNAAYIPRKNGGYITHYGSDEKVEINDEYIIKDTEFRACWVSPLVADITSYSSKDQYQRQMIEVMDTMEAYQLNVMIFHIRIMNDAFYPSKYCNWSEYYNTNPDWECLPWLIEECHKRGIEFHAWMNPYRVANGTHDLSDLSKKFPATNAARDVDNLLQGTNSVILNPGEPNVRRFLVNVCMEVVENYDVDAIHFDDYFYDAGINDLATRNKYNTSNLSIGDFRRAQVNQFIEKLSESIRAYNEENNRCVQLGISPSGVYRADTNRSNGFGVVNYNEETKMVSSDGSRTASASFQHYDNYLYSDTLYWINKEWIDYIVPQTYWALDNGSCPYADLMEWWDEVCSYKNVNLISGLGIYRNTEQGDGWGYEPKEAYNEIMVCNSLNNVNGVCFFKYSNIASAVKDPSITQGVNTIWTNPAILPEIRTAAKMSVEAPKNLTVEKNESGYKLSFSKDDKAKFYVIYKDTKPITEFKSELVIDIIGDISVDGVVNYTDTSVNANDNQTYYYGVREQSYTLSLGEGKSVSTENCKAGTLTNLGEIKEFFASEAIVAGKQATIFFEPFYYPYGDTVKYSLEYSFDDQAKTTATTFTKKRGYYCLDINVPANVKTINAKLTVSNNIGFSSKEIVITIGSALPNITNFMIDGDIYAYNDATFVWNNANIADATYVIQRSLDTIIWEDLVEIDSNKYKDFNIRYKLTLDEMKGDISYRVIIKSNGLVGYSNVVKKSIFSLLGEYEDLTINNKKAEDYYLVCEGDKIIIKWQPVKTSSGYATYIVSYSRDLVDWITMNTYNNRCTLERDDEGYMVQTIPVNYSAFKFYVKINGVTINAKDQSDIFTFYVSVDAIFPDELASYLITLNNSFIEEMDIYK